MGRVIAKDLLETEPECSFTILDSDTGKLEDVAGLLDSDRVRAVPVNVQDTASAAAALRGHSAAIGALPHAYALDALKAGVAAGVSMVDLVGSKPELRRDLNATALEAGVLVIPGFGVAPGLSNVLTARGLEGLDEAHSGVIYVGGLPVKRTPPLEYQTVYSLVSMFGAYLRPAQVWRGGTWEKVPPLTGIEILEFPSIGPLEAFYTDGLASLVLTMGGKFRDTLEEKTLRYPGFAEKVAFLNECGLLEAEPVQVGSVEVAPRDVLIKQVAPLFELSPEGDILVMRVVVRGETGGQVVTHSFELLDYMDPESGDTAMARTTGFPASVAARMISAGDLTEKGVHFPEELFGGSRGDHLLSQLAARSVAVRHNVESS
jgi:lysine 6-dehydrogenase